jgi:hypothetical protein
VAVVRSVDPLFEARHLTHMRILTLTLLLVAPLPTALPAQARFDLSFGATAGTRLLEDRIFQKITITQLIAPTVTLGASLPVSARERAGLEIALGSAKTRVKEAGFPVVVGPGFRTLSITAGVTGPLFRGFTYRGGAGMLKYLPDKEGIFRSGGPLLLILTAGVDYHLPIRGPIGLAARIRYDYQRFSTDELRAIGFSRTQDIHRVGLGLGIEYQRP